MSKILVAYFSRAGENYFGGAIKSVAVGNTEICADLIKQAFPDADLFKIEMAAPYADNYRKCVSQVTADMMLHKRPALTALPESIAAYDACAGLPQLLRHPPHGGGDLFGGVRLYRQKAAALLHQRGQRHGPQRERPAQALPHSSNCPGPCHHRAARRRSPRPRWSGGCRKICNPPAGRRGRRKKTRAQTASSVPWFYLFFG